MDEVKVKTYWGTASRTVSGPGISGFRAIAEAEAGAICGCAHDHELVVCRTVLIDGNCLTES